MEAIDAFMEAFKLPPKLQIVQVARNVRGFSLNAVDIAVGCRGGPWKLPWYSSKNIMYIPEYLARTRSFDMCSHTYRFLRDLYPLRVYRGEC